MERTVSSRLCCALAASALCCAAGAQEQEQAAGSSGERPRAAERVVRVFDFEEKLINPLSVPIGWIRAQHDELVPRIRPNYPIWNEAKLDYSFAHRGEGSVRLTIAGGSASLRLDPGMVPIFPLAEYAVRAAVHSENLGGARPRIVVRALDMHAEPIPGSERFSPPAEPGEGWAVIEATLPGIFAGAAYLQIDLELVQPREFVRAELAEHQVWRDDFEGTAWFDDLVVLQMPQVSVRVASPLGMVVRPAVPTIAAEVRDLAAEDMSATLRVYDASRRLVAMDERKITTGRSSWEWRPELPELGWYRVVLEVASAGETVSVERCDLVWLDPRSEPEVRYERGPSFAGVATAARPATWRALAVELTTLPPVGVGELVEAMGALGVSRAALPLWERDMRLGDIPERVELIAALAGRMREAWIESSFMLPTTPEELSSRLRLAADDSLGAISDESDAWESYLLGAMDRLGTSSAQWQFGRSGTHPATRDPTLAVATARERLKQLVPGVEISLGWRLDASAATLAATGADGASLELPQSMPTPPMETAIGPWVASGGPRATFILEPLSAGLHRERDSAAEMARRLVELWRAASKEGARFRVGLRDPWRIEPGEPPTAHPTPALAAWRNVGDKLEGRIFASEWDLKRGVRCLVFAPSAARPERGGLLVVWNQTAETDEMVATLGMGPVRVSDIFGNWRAVEPTSSEDGTRREHRIAITEEPVFVEGINTGLVLFQTSLALDPPEIQSVTGEHEHAVVMRNPWEVPAVGRIVISEPGGYDPAAQSRDRSWDIAPRTLPFDLGPGAEGRLPIVMSFSRSTEAGPQEFVLDVQLAADEDYGWVRVRSVAEVLWNGVALDVTFRPAEPGPDADLIVEATVTNNSDEAKSFEAVAFAPGMPRVRASIGSLDPGQSVVRRFPFAKAYDMVAGQRVLVSIAEPNGPGRLTKSLEIPARRE